MRSTDKKYLDSLKNYYDCFDRLCKEQCKDEAGVGLVFEHHPLDNDIRDLLKSIILTTDDEFEIFNSMDIVKTLWRTLIEKSIICLRFYDTREPFIEKKEKEPYAYGIKELKDYFDKYIAFESSLYGNVTYYRDHVIHSFRVWLLGIQQLLKENCEYLKRINVEKGYIVNPLEKISVWTIIALTHDLGYPLEKAMEIVDKTRNMMKSFVDNPILMMDLSYSGVQNLMNDYVLRFISSKMREIDPNTGLIIDVKIDKPEIGLEEKQFVARLQPKYYFKFQKSLEHKKHGILSALIIYKLLLYFLESDYSINEDYIFNHEDTRQFYIRREILRAIASHTCHDIYQLNMFNFSFMLLLCDDAQEWGRKGISELYLRKEDIYEFEGITMFFDEPVSLCKVKECYHFGNVDAVKSIMKRFKEQCGDYRDIFRDGQDTTIRNFNFNKITEVKVKGKVDGDTDTYYMKMSVTTTEATKFLITRVGDETFTAEDQIYKYAKEIFKGENDEDQTKLAENAKTIECHLT